MFRKFLFLFLILFSSLETHAEESVLPVCQPDECMQLAKEIGEPYDLSLTLMSMLMVESSKGAGGLLGDIKRGFGKRSYGIMQIQLDTALHVLKLHPELWYNKKYYEEEVIARLLTDHRFNMQVALYQLLWLRDVKKLSWIDMVTAYNTGIAGLENIKDRKNFSYTKSVSCYVNKFQGINTNVSCEKG